MTIWRVDASKAVALAWRPAWPNSIFQIKMFAGGAFAAGASAEYIISKKLIAGKAFPAGASAETNMTNIENGNNAKPTQEKTNIIAAR